MFREDLPGTIAKLKQLGVETAVVPAIPPADRPKERAGWGALGAQLGLLAKRLTDSGLRLGWHNHAFEFETLPDGSKPLEAILGNDAGLLWQPDLAWIVRGNADPKPWLARYRTRIFAFHVKDIAPAGECADEDGWADVGTGTMDFDALLPDMRATPATIWVVEHDNPATMRASRSDLLLPFQGWRGRVVTELGVGVVGCGVISTIYMQNMPLFNGIKLVACADMRADVAKEQAEKFNIPAVLDRGAAQAWRYRYRRQPDAAQRAFRGQPRGTDGGQACLFRKPLCALAVHGRTLVAEAKARNLRLGCAPDTFLGAGGRLARTVIDEARVGRIVGGSCFLMSHGMEHWHPDPEFFYKPGGGPILDIGPYYLGALVNLLGPVAKVQARASTGFAERVVSSQGPRTGDRIKVETPTTVMALLAFANGVDIVFTMSWDVWKHGHPPIELYGTEGSMRVPDPNFFGGTVELSERAGDWQVLDSSASLFGKPNWRAPSWAANLPDRANYRCLGIAEMASAILRGTPHRASGAMAGHVLDVMHAILEAGIAGGTITIDSHIARPAPLSESEAASYWRGPAT